ncbi:uncharacterized protein N7525_009427 [Penicillium rubens]|uniref:uncharacterized protein n=1 Tax=Penicillium rubens TaxID=1108849 RepID=UPI002A5A1E91|nr:uncharacterized protein N7525_009427 [Penicillium rubens]KAJ5831174.1 hypothetical protein N7525_009427 [Penicillium rubens]
MRSSSKQQGYRNGSRRSDQLLEAFAAIGSSGAPNCTSRKRQELPIDVVKYLRFTNVQQPLQKGLFELGFEGPADQDVRSTHRATK